MGIVLMKMMLIINHRYFKSQVFSFKNLFFNLSDFCQINDSIKSERTFSSPPGLSDSICWRDLSTWFLSSDLKVLHRLVDACPSPEP